MQNVLMLRLRRILKLRRSLSELSHLYLAGEIPVISFVTAEYLIERSYYYEQIFLAGKGDRFPGTDY